MKTKFKSAISNWTESLGKPLDEKGRAYYIKSPKGGRRFVIGDIHGCFESFAALIVKLKLNKNDQVFLLGDLVNRGPYSMMVVHYVVDLMEQGYQIFPLRGNHEELIIDSAEMSKGKLRLFTSRQSSSHLADLPKDDLNDLIKFLKKLPYYYETDDAYLVHAGFDSSKKKPLSHWEEMCWIRSFDYDANKFKGKRIFRGHVPRSIDSIKKAVKDRASIIELDNACVKSQFRNFGKLVCLNLDSWELTSQKNVDVVPA